MAASPWPIGPFAYSSQMDARALAGFQAAADRWTRGAFSDNAYPNALTADAWGATDTAAVSHLSPSSCLNVLMNGTGVNPNSAGSGIPFLDNNCNTNNSTIRLTSANARAVGLIGARQPLSDGSVSFSDSEPPWSSD